MGCPDIANNRRQVWSLAQFSLHGKSLAPHLEGPGHSVIFQSFKQLQYLGPVSFSSLLSRHIAPSKSPWPGFVHWLWKNRDTRTLSGVRRKVRKSPYTVQRTQTLILRKLKNTFFFTNFLDCAKIEQDEIGVSDNTWSLPGHHYRYTSHSYTQSPGVGISRYAGNTPNSLNQPGVATNTIFSVSW